MTKLNPKQVALLQQVRAADENLRVAKKTADREARIIVADRITAFEAALDNIVRIAFEADIPRQRIGLEGLLTKNSTTVANILKRTEEVAEALVAANNPLNSRYVLDSDQIRVTLTREEAEEAANNYGQSVPYGAPLSGLFERRSNGWSYKPGADEPMPITHGYTHPVNLWSWDEGNRAELEGWAVEHANSVEAPPRPAVEMGRHG